jgi:hypothetical protein
MSPLGHRILTAKRRRANASLNRDGAMFWGLTLYINSLVRAPTDNSTKG